MLLSFCSFRVGCSLTGSVSVTQGLVRNAGPARRPGITAHSDKIPGSSEMHPEQKACIARTPVPRGKLQRRRAGTSQRHTAAWRQEFGHLMLRVGGWAHSWQPSPEAVPIGYDSARDP